MAKTPPKKLGKSAAILHTRKVFGPERVSFPDSPLNNIEMAQCLSWYNNTKDLSIAKAYILDHLKSTNDERYEGVRKTPDKLIRPTAGWVARMLTLGMKLDDTGHATFDRLLSDSVRVKAEVIEDDAPAPVLVVQKRMVSRATDIIADTESALDEWRTQPFSMSNYLRENKVSANIVSGVHDYYKPLLQEIGEALTGKNKDLKEAYSHLTKTELNRYHRFVSAILSDLSAYATVALTPKVRKPRKKKEVSLDKKLSLLQYLPTFPANQLKSIAPANMLGAKEVWLFETVSKRLTVLRADGQSGLDLNRTTLTGFDPKNSGAKRIGRSTGKHLDGILMNAKTTCKKLFEAIKSDALEATGRINKNTIILKCFR